MKRTACKTAAVVVTYNRKQLLKACLDALLEQSRSPDRIYIIDNASTDGTSDFLKADGYLENSRIIYLRQLQNTGGAGGFHAGMQQALTDNMDWLWLMDDDACPRKNALESLLQCHPEKENVYASVAINTALGRDELCWPAARPGTENAFVLEEIQLLQNVINIPFLGFFIHSDLVRAIGLPEKDYFILGDDTEYAERARAHGSKLLLVKRSIVDHPMPNRHIFSFMGRRFYNLTLPPWKKYYDVRNRILIGRKYYGIRLWTQTIPGQIIRMGDSLLHEPDRFNMLWAYLRGILDGFLGRQGKRVIPG